MIELALAEFGLQCALPKSLATLTELQRVDLSLNQLSGDASLLVVPHNALVNVDISHNRFKGPVP